MTERSIIAMKGAPFTRKTEIATFIATSLRCPLLSLDDFLDVMDPDQVQISTSPAEDLAFKMICQITKSHFLKGVCDKIVIDSPLLSRFHLDQLFELVNSLKKTRVVIVECKPENKYSWQMEFEEYVQRNRGKIESKWYKAKTWDDVQKALIQDEYESSASKLILDPIWDHLKIIPLSLGDLAILNLKKLKSDQPPPLMEAIEYMMTRENGLVVHYSQWRYSEHQHCESSESVNTEIDKKQEYYCKDGHTITKYTELGFDESDIVNCMGCGKEVKGSAYTCSYCNLALHKECAESFEYGKKHTYISCTSNRISPKYGFPKTFACTSCKQENKPFSDNCMSCLFESHLKYRCLPTVIWHNCHKKHFLSIVFLRQGYVRPEAYKCLACGELVSIVFYSCKVCSVYYHVNCITQIRKGVDDEHGGHHHRMQLKFSCEEAEDYHCDECLERRDPQLWFYSCKFCKFDVHLDCIFKKNINIYIRPSRWGKKGFY